MEVTEVDDLPNINRVSKYLQIDGKQLTKVLTTQSMVVGKETVRRHLTTRQSLDQRDSLIKAVYNQLFEYIIEFINETLGVGLLNAENSRSIGILDIFGFENLPQNSFEQFCINYSNEILQQHFIRQIYKVSIKRNDFNEFFKLEQADYESQQIGWQHLDYIDNQPVINLMAGSHLGIFQLIDEESVFPQVYFYVKKQIFNW
jgi:myosin heavy subunit